MTETNIILFDENLLRLGKSMPNLMPYCVMARYDDWDAATLREEFQQFYISTTEREGRKQQARNVEADEHQDYGFLLAEQASTSTKRDVVGLITGHSIADLVARTPALEGRVSDRMYLIKHLMLTMDNDTDIAAKLIQGLKEHAGNITDAEGNRKYSGHLVFSLPVQEQYQDLQNFIIAQGFRKLLTDRSVTPPVRYFTNAPGLPDHPTSLAPDTKVQG